MSTFKQMRNSPKFQLFAWLILVAMVGFREELGFEISPAFRAAQGYAYIGWIYVIYVFRNSRKTES